MISRWTWGDWLRFGAEMAWLVGPGLLALAVLAGVWLWVRRNNDDQS